MEIYLAKPGGQKEGPFSLDQINRDLASKKYSGSDYWAWYEGLPSWMPLHSLPGVSSRAAAVVPPATPVSSVPAKPEPVASAPAKPEPAASSTSAEMAGTVTPQKSVSSGLPFSTLEHVFIFTSGEMRSVLDSQQTRNRLQDTVGEPLSKIQEKAPPNVVGRVEAEEELMGDDSIPARAWRAMTAVKPEIAEQAKAGAYHHCVRTFLSEQNDVITLVLFYKK